MSARTKRDPLDIAVIAGPDAPRTEADWTPDQRDAAIRSLVTVLHVLSSDAATTPGVNDETTDREVA